MTRRLCACGCRERVTGRADKVYASEACSKRARRQAADEAKVHRFPSLPPTTLITEALRKELVDLGVDGTFEGQAALGMAEQLDSGRLIGAGFVSLSKELDRRVEVLRMKAPKPDDPAEAIRLRLEEHMRLIKGGDSA